MPCAPRSANRRRLLSWTLGLLVVVTAPVLAEEEVLLSLPREFDVTARLPALDAMPSSIERPPPLVFRFRGDSFRATNSWAYHSGTHVWEEVYEGTFRRGRLEGTYESFVRVSYAEPPTASAGCAPLPGGVHFKEWQSGKVGGTATPDGILSLTLRVASHRAVSRRSERDYNTSGCYRDMGWVDVTRESETEWAQKWTPYTATILLRLPVGELQSSQKLSTPPPPRARPGADGGSAGPSAATPGAASVEGAAAGGRASGGAGPRTTGRPAAADPAESPWSVPVTPGEAAGAGAVVALTSLLGALWMFGTSGLSPGDLLGSPPEADAPEPPPAEAPSPRELFVEHHRDGEVNADTGEVWSENVGGWVGSNYHEIERRAQAEVRRAQGVSDRESRRESGRIAERLRASRKREAEAVRRGTQAADEADRLQAVTIDPYRPGVVDEVTKGLEWAELGTDTSISVLGSMAGTPGQAFAEVYTVTKETVKGLSEGVADYARDKGGHLAEEGSLWVIAERGAIGATKGVAKVGLDRATGNLMDGAGGELAETEAAQGAKTVVKTVTDQLDSPAGVEVCRSAGVAVGKTVLGSELQAPVKAVVKGATGESL